MKCCISSLSALVVTTNAFGIFNYGHNNVHSDLIREEEHLYGNACRNSPIDLDILTVAGKTYSQSKLFKHVHIGLTGGIESEKHETCRSLCQNNEECKYFTNLYYSSKCVFYSECETNAPGVVTEKLPELNTNVTNFTFNLNEYTMTHEVKFSADVSPYDVISNPPFNSEVEEGLGVNGHNETHLQVVFDEELNKDVLELTMHRDFDTDGDDEERTGERQRTEWKATSGSEDSVIWYYNEKIALAYWFKLGADIKGADGFFHIFQVKNVGVNADSHPLNTITLRKNRFTISDREAYFDVADLSKFQDQWVQAIIEIRFHDSEGSVSIRFADIEGNVFFNYASGKGDTWLDGVDVSRYKMGMYRKLDDTFNEVDTIRFSDITFFKNEAFQKPPPPAIPTNEYFQYDFGELIQTMYLDFDGVEDPYVILEGAPLKASVEESIKHDVKHFSTVFDDTLNKTVVHLVMHRDLDGEGGSERDDRQKSMFRGSGSSDDIVLGYEGDVIAYPFKMKLGADFKGSSQHNTIFEILFQSGSVGTAYSLTVKDNRLEFADIDVANANSKTYAVLANDILNQANDKWLQVIPEVKYTNDGYVKITIVDDETKEILGYYLNSGDNWFDASYARPRYGMYRKLHDSHNEQDEVSFADVSIFKL